MAKTEMSREEFEEALGFKIFDWQWEWVKSRANNEKRLQFVPRQNGGRYGFFEIMDERSPGEAFCSNCPDHEGCMQGLPCSMVKRVDRESREAEMTDGG